MNDCRRTAERLASYADGALPPHERIDVEAHLGRCPPCRDAADHERNGRTVLRECAARLKATPLPPGLETRCRALAREHCLTGPGFWTGLFGAGWKTTVVPVALVALLLVFTASTIFSLATHRSDGVLAAQLTADHAKCFALFDEPDAADADPRRVEAELAESYGFEVHVPGSSPDTGVHLVGARRCLYADGSIPHVMYHVDGEPVSLFMLDGVTRPSADVVSLGHRAQIWSRGATTYVLVSPASGGDLSRAARYVMQEVH